MSTEVTLPALGESVTEGTVSRWLKAVGDTVSADEPLLEVSTDKVDTEIPSPAAGTLLEIRVDEDETVDVGAVLAVIGDADESSGESGSDGADAGADDNSGDNSGSSDNTAAGSDQAEPADADEAQEDTSAADENRQPEPRGSDDSSSAGSSGGSGGGGSASGTEITLPELGESVTEGTVSRWLKSVGDSVEVDEALLEISTDKVDTEIPSPAAGTLLEIRVQEDETVEVGSVLAVVGDQAAAPASEPEQPEPEPEPEAKKPEAKPEPEPEAKPEPEPEPKQAPKQDSEQAKPAPAVAPRAQGDSSGSGDGYVTPLVRKLAAEHDVDLSTLEGTGVGGRIRKQDVLAAAEAAKAPAPEPEQPAAATPAPTAAAPSSSLGSAQPSSLRGTTAKMTRLRKTIARRMVESLQVSAQLTATVEVDLTAISRIRARVKNDFKAREGASLSYLPFITKAVVEALKVFPNVNATVDEDTITYPGAEHVGIAVDTEKGLLVPVIKDAGDLNITGLAKKIGDLAARTRSNKIGPDELGGGTFTITNYGSAGTLMDTPIINQPQVAILGTGALVKRPMVISDPRLGEVIAVRDMMYLSMSYDHRIVDGADAARFLSAVKARLEEGDFGSEFGL